VTALDQYGLPLSTDSADAAEAYIDGLELALRVDPAAPARFVDAVGHDPTFALAYAALAFHLQFEPDPAPGVGQALLASHHAARATVREQQHAAILRRAAVGDWASVAALASAHLAEYPRDVLVLWQLIRLLGYGGDPHRKAKGVAVLAELEQHYAGDRWFGAAYGLALSETGQLAPAERVIGAVLDADDDHPLGAHSWSHLTFERHDDEEGRAFLARWLTPERGGMARGHLLWHLALCEIALGNLDGALEVFRSHRPMGDDALDHPESVLWRLRLRGADVDAEMASVADTRRPPSSGVNATFELVHDALVAAGVGDGAAVDELGGRPAHHASDDVAAVFATLVAALRLVADGRWADAVPSLDAASTRIQLIGGSNEQHVLFHELLAFARSRVGRDVATSSP
jgi:hypothetical protein